jgi:hypothetical protein
LQSTAWRGGFWSAQAVRSDPAPPTFVVLAALVFRTLNPLTARALPSECLATQVEPGRIASSLPAVRWGYHAPQRVQRSRQPVSIRVAAGPPFASSCFRARATFGVGAVRRNLPFGSHGTNSRGRLSVRFIPVLRRPVVIGEVAVLQLGFGRQTFFLRVQPLATCVVLQRSLTRRNSI